MVATILVLFRGNGMGFSSRNGAALIEAVGLRLSNLKTLLTTKCAKYAKVHNYSDIMAED
jgi:hypothetical protein